LTQSSNPEIWWFDAIVKPSCF